jgi:hypothetical protein
MCRRRVMRRGTCYTVAMAYQDNDSMPRWTYDGAVMAVARKVWQPILMRMPTLRPADPPIAGGAVL